MENKNKLFVLVGKSASGKSTIEIAIDKSGYAEKLCSATTRSPRSYEKDMVDYYFISEEVFDIYKNQNYFAEHSVYPTKEGEKQYGIMKYDIKLDNYNCICVVNPDGYRQLIDSVKEENIIGIYIKRDDRERIISALSRDSNDFDFVLGEVYRRYEADKVDFAGIEDKVKYVVENRDLDQAIQDVIKIIEEETK